MSDAEIHAAALSDPDAQPLTAERLAGMKQTPRLKIIRRALGLTQEDFAARFLRAVAGDAAAVQRALAQRRSLVMEAHGARDRRLRPTARAGHSG